MTATDIGERANPVGAQRRPAVGAALARNVRQQLPVAISLAVIFAVGSVGSTHFLTAANMSNLLGRAAPLGIMAVGTMVLMIAGQIDLSIGSMVSLITLLAAKSANENLGTIAIVVICMTAAALFGIVTGLVVTLTRAPSFMITLGGLSIYAGLAAAWTQNQPVMILTGLKELGVSRLLGVPLSVYLLVVVMLVVYALLYHLRAGRSIFAIGGNEEAARLAGIKVDLVRVCVFALSGALVGLAATILASRVGSGDPTSGVGLELQVIAAVVIGGATLAGGHGSLLGTILGVLLLTTIANVLNLLGVQSYVSTVVFGAFVVLAVCLRGERTVRFFSGLRRRVRVDHRHN